MWQLYVVIPLLVGLGCWSLWSAARDRVPGRWSRYARFAGGLSLIAMGALIAIQLRKGMMGFLGRFAALVMRLCQVVKVLECDGGRIRRIIDYW